MKNVFPVRQLDGSGFLAWDGYVQQRYEALRDYMLFPGPRQRRSTSARFCLARFIRYGLLGLLDRDPLGRAWGSRSVDAFQVEMVPVGVADTEERMARLSAILYRACEGTLRTSCKSVPTTSMPHSSHPYRLSLAI